MFKYCDENNYVTETLRRTNDFLYETEFENWEFEGLRINQFFVMNEGGSAVSLDKLNEFLNLWKKDVLRV